jgi:hypothetical protein
VTSREENTVRIDVLRRLAEQAMSDPVFRADAREDLQVALQRHGYDLTVQELALVLRFRRSLAEAGVDLDLVSGMGDELLANVLDRLESHAQRAGWS